ncbi:M48 family metallopeptidase [Novosphingobium sp. TH158]|uniref:M48 family metallopeptidase n=1 Tax=Novosphingobium sp. TH158 TaxID=2067455 RepID=UPI000C7D9320|nr:SprT family zinc-dependent metalloprotease [Novosphingobium sp. TH158]PLK26615.1 metal-dependent hydrolase [Novosphingobium sp. TH158]
MLDWLRHDPRQDPTIEVAGKLLPVQVRRNPRARRLTMRLAPDGTAVQLTVPRWTPTREAIAFARQGAPWLERQLERIVPQREIADGSVIPFRGLPHAVRHDPALPRRVMLEEGAIRLGGLHDSVAARLERWLRAEAQARLAEDLAYYCARAARSVPALGLSGAQRRWGSCSSKGVIRINWRLIMAPDHVRRSVVAHEVTHLAHFDHSPAFHAALAELYEADISLADHWLKREGRSLYVHFG